MPLERYRHKRDFGKTPEPAGSAASAKPAATAPAAVVEGPAAVGSGGRFVVQRHRATRLHYDFRLEMGGVLASWAVPKGPTLDSAIRRMAVHVEDHPIEYFDFEGVIPARQYGAGDVIVWDWGTWEPEAPTLDPVKAVHEGELKFRLFGEKLKGRFTIVRTTRGADGRRATSDQGEGEGDQWLLIHKRDESAVAGWDAEDHPESVKTGRTNDDVKAQRDAVWISQAPAAQAEIDLAGAVTAPMPDFIEPMLATLTDEPFDNPDWLFEIKWDGYRMEALVSGGKVRLRTRNGKDGETYFPGFLSPGTWIAAREAIVDGEVVALAPDGRPDFGLLQQRIGQRPGAAEAPSAPLVYEVFDLLYLDGRSLLQVPLEDRKRLLRSVLVEQPRVRYATHVDGDGVAFYRAAAERQLEGVIAKHRRSIYEPGHRTRNWLKVKVRPEQELVVGGYLPGEGTHTELGALIVGVYEGKKLRYAGRVGSGIDTRTRRELRERLDAMLRDTPPFDPPPERKGDLRDARWVDPKVVIRAEFSNWTRDNLVRQAAFKGFEPEKDPRAVVRERPVDSADASAKAGAEVDAAEKAPKRRARSKAKAEFDGAAESPRGRPTTKPRVEIDVAEKAPKGRAGTKAKAEATMPSGRPPEARAPASPAATGAGASAKPASASRKPAGPGAPAMFPQAATADEIAALERMGPEGVWHVGGRELKLTNLDKVLFPPAAGETAPVTKRELIRYFALIAPVMLPHLANRPLNLHRYPNGPKGPGFWQKDIPPSAPDWLTIWHETGVSEERKANDHLVADQVATLCWLGNQAAFEIHAWTSTIDDPWRPTFALIDIDPGTKTTWEDVLVLARLYRAALEHLKVRAYPKVTGKRGIQVWIPIRPKYDYSQTSAWVEQVSRAVGAMVPNLVSWEWAVADRQGRARLDYTQNASIKTLVAPYSVRPSDGAPVSAPITWAELDDPELRPDLWTIRSIIGRVAKVGDLFAGALDNDQDLPRL